MVDDDDSRSIDEKRAEWRRLTNAATPGPWRACGSERGICQCTQVWSTAVDMALVARYRDDDSPHVPLEEEKANAAFIAAAREAMSVLLDDVERVQGQHVEALDNWSEQETRANRAEDLCMKLADCIQRALFEDTVLEQHDLCEGLPDDWRKQVGAMRRRMKERGP